MLKPVRSRYDLLHQLRQGHQRSASEVEIQILHIGPMTSGMLNFETCIECSCQIQQVEKFRDEGPLEGATRGTGGPLEGQSISRKIYVPQGLTVETCHKYMCGTVFTLFVCGAPTMARPSRAEVFDPNEVAIAHVFNRPVRRCFLMGDDALSGKNFDHRKAWIEDYLRQFAAFFGIDLICYAIMSNHFHLILRSRPDVVATWDNREVARRWLMICPERRSADVKPLPPNEAEINSIANSHPCRTDHAAGG